MSIIDRIVNFLIPQYPYGDRVAAVEPTYYPPPPPASAPPDLDPYVRAACGSPAVLALPSMKGPGDVWAPAPPEAWARHVLAHAEALRAADRARLNIERFGIGQVDEPPAERAGFASGRCNGRGSFGSYSESRCLGCAACEPAEEPSR